MESDILPISEPEAALLSRLSPEMREGVLKAREEAREIVAAAPIGSCAAVAMILLDVSGAGLPAFPTHAAEQYDTGRIPVFITIEPDALERLPTRRELAHLLASESPYVRTVALRLAARVLSSG